MKILHLTIKRKWFDLIRSGIKTEEYREIKKYWDRRFAFSAYSAFGPEWDVVCFRNGYRPDSPRHTRKLCSIRRGKGLPWWGAPAGKDVWILKLGDPCE